MTKVLEVRRLDGPLHVAGKRRRPDEWDAPVEPYDPYGPGASGNDFDVITEEPATRDAVNE